MMMIMIMIVMLGVFLSEPNRTREFLRRSGRGRGVGRVYRPHNQTLKPQTWNLELFCVVWKLESPDWTYSETNLRIYHLNSRQAQPLSLNELASLALNLEKNGLNYR